MKKPSDITITDQFCGAGGSSIGATAAGARRIGKPEDLNGSGKKCWAVPQVALKPVNELSL